MVAGWDGDVVLPKGARASQARRIAEGIVGIRSRSTLLHDSLFLPTVVSGCSLERPLFWGPA